jgi:hypothetical protein
MGTRLIELFKDRGAGPWGMRAQPNNGPSQPALWEQLRTTRFVPPAQHRELGGEGRAIYVRRVAYGRLTHVDDQLVRWSDEWARPSLTKSYACFDVEDRFRIEAANEPAIAIVLRNVHFVVLDDTPDPAEGEALVRVLFVLHRPAPLLIGPPTLETPQPAELNWGRAGSAGMLFRRPHLGGEDHARIAPYLGHELLLEFAPDRWGAFESACAELGLPVPVHRRIKVERAALYSTHDLGRLDAAIADIGHLGVAFQLDALSRNGVLTPDEVITVAKDAKRSLQAERVPEHVVQALQGLATDCRPRLAIYGEDDVRLRGHDWRELWDRRLRMRYEPRGDDDANVFTSRVFVTPTRLVLDGPYAGVSNRILREYDRPDSFIRVALVDEDLSPFAPNTIVDVKAFMLSRFGPVLRNGISLAGRHFTFLAFSMSSLRDHTCWCVADPVVEEAAV